MFCSYCNQGYTGEKCADCTTDFIKVGAECKWRTLTELSDNCYHESVSVIKCTSCFENATKVSEQCFLKCKTDVCNTTYKCYFTRDQNNLVCNDSEYNKTNISTEADKIFNGSLEIINTGAKIGEYFVFCDPGNQVSIDHKNCIPASETWKDTGTCY